MKTKTKLTLGVGLLFLLIVLVSVVGAKYINELKEDSENILIANYNSLDYCRNMLIAIEEFSERHSENALLQFDQHLKNQEQNITEAGEEQTTARIRSSFGKYIIEPEKSKYLTDIRRDVFQLMDMNMQAIQRKSQVAQSTAEKAVSWIAVTGSLCFIIAFVLLINLPSHIANPIKELTESIRQIASKNYSERVHFESHSEFGQLAKSFNSMAEKLEEYNNSNVAKLMMEKKRIETLINNMHDPVIGLDENLKVIFANEEAIKISGLNQTELLGQYARDLAVTNDLIRSLLQDLLATPNKQNQPLPSIKIFTENKENYFEKEIIHISITPTGENVSKVVGHVIFLRNVTSYKELDSAKTNFIATVSHEFKTPISAIKMSASLLENEKIGSLNIEQRNLIDSIKDDAERLLKITGELLNMTQVESGNIQLAIQPSDPCEIVHYALQANKTLAEQKQITLVFRPAEKLSRVQADSEKTAWILTNLISNAIHYSHENSEILISIEETENHISFSVKDTGQGIDPKYKDKIFDRYFRVPGSTKEGTGLGLAISKEFIEAQGGSILVESEFGAGSVFRVILDKA